MNGFHGLVERWGALASGVVLLALPLTHWFLAGSMGSIDIVLGGVGIGALLVAIDDFLRRAPRELHRACPHCGESLAEGT